MMPARKIKGRKRHIVRRTSWAISLKCGVHAASIQDQRWRQNWSSRELSRRPPKNALRKLWADGGYAGALIDWVKVIWNAI